MLSPILDPVLLELIPEDIRPKVAHAFARVEELERRNRILLEEIRLLNIKRYGASAERLSDGQLAMFETEPGVCAAEVELEAARSEAEKAVASPEDPNAPKRKKAVRGPLPAHLPREERIIHCAQSDCFCGQCGGAKKVIGYEVSERVSIKPIEFFVEVTKREKMACARCEEMGVNVAPVPPSIIEKGILSDALVVDVVLKKYAEHLPLYRQSATILRDAAIEVSQSTLSTSVLKVGELLGPICSAMRQDLLLGSYIQADETTVPVQSKRTKGKDHQAYLWEYGRPGGPVVYEFRMGREREGPKNWLADFGGRLQTDGYAAYDKIGAATISYFGCWAHARRKFWEASKVNPKDTASVAIVVQIRELYALEAKARDLALSVEAREALRLAHAVPVLAKIKSMVIEARAAALPKSLLGKACTYAINQWERLERYAGAGNGCVEIDNNIAENGMRGIAIGRRNWVHIGSEEAGPRIAPIISVLETCKRLKINAREYLKDVLPQIANWNSTQIAELTPMAWLARRNQAA
jgi:transposase